MRRNRKSLIVDRQGASAVEFSLVFPILLVLVYGISCYGYIFEVLHSIQQLAAESARASVSGMSDAERDSIARTFVSKNLASYPLLSRDLVVVKTVGGSAPDYTFQVSLSYDLSTSFIYQFARVLPLPLPSIQRSAVIQRGGY